VNTLNDIKSTLNSSTQNSKGASESQGQSQNKQISSQFA